MSVLGAEADYEQQDIFLQPWPSSSASTLAGSAFSLVASAQKSNSVSRFAPRHGFNLERVIFPSALRRREYSLISGNAMSVPAIGACLLAAGGPISAGAMAYPRNSWHASLKPKP